MQWYIIFKLAIPFENISRTREARWRVGGRRGRRDGDGRAGSAGGGGVFAGEGRKRGGLLEVIHDLTRKLPYQRMVYIFYVENMAK